MQSLADLANRPLPTPHPALHAANRELDPEQPLVTDAQISMYYELDVDNVAGLNRAMAEIAREANEVSKSSTWRHVADREGDRLLLHMLNTIELDVLKALIRGDLMTRYYDEDAFREKIDANHTLKKTAGNYLQLLCRAYTKPVDPPTPATQTSQSTQANYRALNEYAGRGLTFKQLYAIQNAIWDSRRENPVRFRNMHLIVLRNLVHRIELAFSSLTV